MDEEESLRVSNLPVDNDQKPLSPYELLLRQSRKMGGVATRTYDITKEFLKKDARNLTSRQPEAILFGKKILDKKLAEFRENRQIVDDVAKRSHEVLASARTVILPINLFTDSVTVDRTKVTITKRSFFWTAQVITTRIEDILSVTSNFGPLFGSLTISTRVMNSTDHFEVNYFWRKDAQYLKRIIQGYVIAQHNQIKTDHLTQEELIDTLLEIGQDSTL